MIIIHYNQLEVYSMVTYIAKNLMRRFYAKKIIQNSDVDESILQKTEVGSCLSYNKKWTGPIILDI